jgi:hypothetical protein
MDVSNTMANPKLPECSSNTSSSYQRRKNNLNNNRNNDHTLPTEDVVSNLAPIPSHDTRSSLHHHYLNKLIQRYQLAWIRQSLTFATHRQYATWRLPSSRHHYLINLIQRQQAPWIRQSLTLATLRQHATWRQPLTILWTGKNWIPFRTTESISNQNLQQGFRNPR